ncbi:MULTISPECIES: helix-turn-helix transcriptional regulator [Klebsiella]|uniref:LuxR C-terminal-related transcriptional regulator n=1 Tax=Klebsiella michiganensis TaxID=1134687 RepID=A0AB35PTY6_9ENTR|nr:MULTISPECIES: LuxR C-terminal-related transcriptional regulator [Klebsiella]APM31130.1 helix-turn-helix transcriptional regulator [Klebsiella oxytoca]MDU1358190.1 LuxR C-terminal-related transcriptional regulator [Citrobacter freundii]AIE71823.1 LuxR family transcriptional regulator [Klebsiella michiganensis]AOV13617.1 helix-turn-helix transcriptional regulator [Klebsiella sp. LTGPAF-6F]AUV90825.1 helix-turn-helix transcriptional regulator [Klebsiella oxytoca]
MNLSDSVFSDDYFFIVGISALLTPGLIDENYSIIDIETTSLSEVRKHIFPGRKVIVFITNDLDYYALKHMADFVFIDKKCRLNEILSGLLVKNSQYNYRVKYSLSRREKEVLSCMQKGLDVKEISRQLGMTMKTFYTHRRSLIFKLQQGNRISLYQNIVRSELYKQSVYEYG